MASFNYIPDHLRVKEPPDWTPEQGRRHGAWYIAFASVAIATLATALGFMAPFLTQHALLNCIWGFLITFALLAAVRKASGMIDLRCTLMAIPTALPPLAASHIGIVMNLAASNESTFAATWASHGLIHMAFSNVPATVGIGITAILCKDGNYSLLDFLDFLMINPFTGRRV